MQCDAIKAELKARLETLRARVADIEGDLRSSHSQDSTERAVEMEDDEVLEGLESSALAEIKKIKAALQRIESGDYGSCAQCGEPIKEARLKAAPYAVLCLGCAS